MPPSAPIALSGVIATTPKFVASKGGTGACLWAVGVSEPVAQAVPYSGAIVFSTGANAPLNAGTGTYGACPSGTDAIPDDTTPGDVITLGASVSSYVKASCATSTPPVPVAEWRLTACSIRRDSRGHALPTPATVATLAELTNAATDAAHRKWTGVLVKIDNAQGVDIGTGGPVGATGTIALANGVKVRDRIYQPRIAAFGRATTWTSIVGIAHLDVCTWAVEPRDPCTDFSPKSTNCP